MSVARHLVATRPCNPSRTKEELEVLSSILVVALVVLLLGVVPTWPYSRDWSYYPTGVVGTVLLVTIMLILSGTL
jgi:hypothetical protein